MHLKILRKSLSMKAKLSPAARGQGLNPKARTGVPVGIREAPVSHSEIGMLHCNLMHNKLSAQVMKNFITCQEKNENELSKSKAKRTETLLFFLFNPSLIFKKMWNREDNPKGIHEWYLSAMPDGDCKPRTETSDSQ